MSSVPSQNKIIKQFLVDNGMNKIGCTDLEISKPYGLCDHDYQPLQIEPSLK